VVYETVMEAGVQGVLARVRGSYGGDKAWGEMSGELPAYVLYRPISFYVTVPLLVLGVPAWGVTLASAVCALALPFVAVTFGAHAYALVGALALAVHVLDCVDGNLARVRGPTRVGALLDAAVDGVFWAAFFAALGLLVERGHGWLAPRALAFSLFAAVLVFLGRRVRDEFVRLYGVRAEMPPARPARLGLAAWALFAVAGLEQLYAFVVLAAGAAGALDIALAGILVYVTSVFAASVAITFAHAWRRDRAAASTDP
jgi:phosphatidylglycerophosphate synthase